MTPKNKRSKYFDHYLFKYEGKTFPSIKQCCDFYEINYSSVMSYKRMNKCSAEEAITYYRKIKEQKEFTFHNRKWKNLNSCCNYYGLNAGSVKTYMWKHNCSIAESLEHSYTVQKENSFIYHGVRYKSIKDCCQAYGINENTVCQYKNRKKISATRAITYHIKKKEQKFTFRNIDYGSLKECCLAYNLNANSVSSLASKEHITNQNAMELLLKRRKDAVFSFGGVDYPSFEICCNRLGVNSASVRSRAWRLKCSLSESLQHFAK